MVVRGRVRPEWLAQGNSPNVEEGRGPGQDLGLGQRGAGETRNPLS